MRTSRILIAFVVSLFVLSNLFGQQPKTKTFEDYSRMESKRERATSFLSETAKNKSVLWRRHIEYHETRLNLNKEQIAILDRLTKLLTEEFFEDFDPISKTFMESEQGQMLIELEREASELFNRKLQKKLFSVIGDTSSITDFSMSCEKPNKLELVKTRIDIVPLKTVNIVKESSQRDCECSKGSSFNFECPNTFTCKDTFLGCTVIAGCGFLGFYPCDGMCVYTPDGDV